MKLHIFNPEHDIALASGLSNFTAPHAGRQLRSDVGFLPALWAGAGECVLVEHADEAEQRFRRLMHRPFGRFVEKQMLSVIDISRVEPWGWDAALKAFLLRMGVRAEVLPGDERLRLIRQLSSRATAVAMLPLLQGSGRTGESVMARSLGEAADALARWQSIVVKAPWSSSGRGVRFVGGQMAPAVERWMAGVIRRQGAVAIEPHYRKVRDFAMEFEADGQGAARYSGLSLFQAENGAYQGNIIASEEEKMEMISRYLPERLLRDVQEEICQCFSRLQNHPYQGPFGVDMMVVARPDAQGFLLHPCVELNLRRTMGHVALGLQHCCPLPSVMRVVCSEDHYKIKIQRI